MKPKLPVRLAAGRPSAIPALALVALLGLAVPACAAGDKPAPAQPPAAAGSEPVAEVAGRVITRAELEQSMVPELRRQYRQLLEQAVELIVEERLLEAEAAARGVDVQALIQTEIEAKATEVSDADANAFYEENKARINRPLEQIQPQIKQYLGQLQRQKLRDDLVAALRAKHGAKVLLEVDRMEVAEADSPAKGPAGAPVTVIEFSDFECPFCGRVLPALKQVQDTYGDQVRIVFRQFPLNIHPRAQKAAEASLCAHEQGKFWELHDAMFADQRALGVDELKTKAAGLGLNAEAFASCLDSGKHAAKVAADMADGQKAGVTGTPAMFVNGRFLSGAVPFETLEKLIDDELARKGIAPRKTVAQ